MVFGRQRRKVNHLPAIFSLILYLTWYLRIYITTEGERRHNLDWNSTSIDLAKAYGNEFQGEEKDNSADRLNVAGVKRTMPLLPQQIAINKEGGEFNNISRGSLEVISHTLEAKAKNALSLSIVNQSANKTVMVNNTNEIYTEIDNITTVSPSWQQRLKDGVMKKDNYELIEIVWVRIYEDDKAKWTAKELKQWLHYLFLAGVQHVFLCDNFREEGEKLRDDLVKYMQAGMMTYIEWDRLSQANSGQTQCYTHVLRSMYMKDHTKWVMTFDMDEYPFAPNDLEEDFLLRYVSKMTQNPKVSEISVLNFLMLGQGDRSKDLTIERINRIAQTPSKVLVKPMFQPSKVQPMMHRGALKSGIRIKANPDDLRMLHYWGSRLQNWGNDTEKMLSLTQEYNVMRDIWGPRIRASLHNFGEGCAFSTETGP